MKKFQVYNLEFPPFIETFTVGEYRFSRLADYADRIRRLQHRVSNNIGGVWVDMTPGQHETTAEVEFPNPEEKGVIFSNGTSLSDILLLLSLFLGRDIFISEEEIAERDVRLFGMGLVLSMSLPRTPILKDGQSHGNPRFEDELNRVYSLIKTESWRKLYRDGYLLMLANHAFRPQSMNAHFTQCWTIWEHLFSILNDHWLSADSIHKIEAQEKISYLLTRYALRPHIDNSSREKIKHLTTIRNRLIHYGDFPGKSTESRANNFQYAYLFLNITEFIIAKILDLVPSDVFKTMDNLEAYFTQKERGGKT